MAFPWPCKGMLCWASIFSDDHQAYFYTWPWCHSTPGHCWVAGICFITFEAESILNSLRLLLQYTIFPCLFYLYDLLFCVFCHTGKASFHCLWADPCWGMIFRLWHSYVNSLLSNGCSVHKLYILPGFECKTWVASNFSE